MTKIKNIFVVDDNEMFAQMLKDHLSENPQNKVFVFYSGEDCLKNMYLLPDLIILDYNLSNDKSEKNASGLAILQVIKKQIPSPHVIMLSGQERYGVALETISKGAEFYIIKDNKAFENIDLFINGLN